MGDYEAKNNMPLEKPELGCKPYYVAASDRINELSEAIQRYSRKSRLDYNHIRKWTKEIEMLCDIVETLDSMEIDKANASREMFRVSCGNCGYSGDVPKEKADINLIAHTIACPKCGSALNLPENWKP